MSGEIRRIARVSEMVSVNKHSVVAEVLPFYDHFSSVIRGCVWWVTEEMRARGKTYEAFLSVHRSSYLVTGGLRNHCGVFAQPEQYVKVATFASRQSDNAERCWKNNASSFFLDM